MSELVANKSLLGKTVSYAKQYAPELLFPIARSIQRTAMNITQPLPFEGVDIWNSYELSWLDSQGKPHIAIAEFYIPCDSPNIVESKSFKLYLISFNSTQFKDVNAVQETLLRDLSAAVGKQITLRLLLPPFASQSPMLELTGIYLDDLPISVDTYSIHPEFLVIEATKVKETVYSNLLKSNCLVTHQPDWGSVLIHYEGKKINHAGLLKYIISFREHNEFHEPCVERIFVDIMRQCQPDKLTVYARYTRRGGLDINPFRSNFEQAPTNFRNLRQ